MKAILVDIKDMSDSRELYEAKPNSFLWIFTYILLTLIAAAIIWASIGEIEIVVKANGQVRPEAGISTVRNLYGGVVKDVNYEQGLEVKKGDLLYVIEHDTLLIEKENLVRQFEELNNELDNLKKYRESIITEKNLFDNMTEPEYYQKVENLLLELKYTRNNSNYSIVRLEEEIKINQAQLSRYIEEKSSIEKYIMSLDQDKNLVDSETGTDIEYCQKFENYIITKRELDRQYDERINQINANNFETLKLTLNEEIALKEAYELLLLSIKQGKSYFSEENQYSYLYDDYVFNVRNLKNQYEEARDVYEAYKSLENYGVSKVEIENARIQMEKAEGAYLNYESSYLAEIQRIIKEKEINILDLENRICGSSDKETLLKLNEEDRENALKKLYLTERQNMTDLREKISETINTLQLTIKLGEIQLDSILNNKEDNSNVMMDVERMKSREIVNTDEHIKSLAENIKTIEQHIKKVELDITNSMVRANIDGTVDVLYEMLPGDFVASGQEVLKIIPDNDTAYKMQIFVSNQDIGELNVGDTVKYNFAALPSREYGEMRGSIVNISKDALLNEATGQSFYVVEATIPGTKLIGSNGKQGEIKNGMLCEASIITKQKSFLRYFLEKIDLLD